jgi:hypothetical protein
VVDGYAIEERLGFDRVDGVALGVEGGEGCSCAYAAEGVSYGIQISVCI